MDYIIKLNETLLDTVRSYLLGDPLGRERMCYLMGSVVEGRSETILLVRNAVFPNPSSEKTKSSRTRVTFEKELRAEIYTVFAESGSRLIVNCHSHPFDEGNTPYFSTVDDEGNTPYFSTVDDESDLDEAKFFKSLKSTNSTSASIVFSQTGLNARVNLHDRKFLSDQISKVVVLGQSIGSFEIKSRIGRSPVFSRQIDVLSQPALNTVRSLKIGVVGLGGTGSLISQHLARLQVAKIVGVDDDVVEVHNLNRLESFCGSDIGKSKGDAIRDIVKNIDQSVCFDFVDDQIPSEAGEASLKVCDIIFGCVDNNRSRYHINKMGVKYGIPVVDVATSVSVETKRMWRWRSNVMVPGTSRCFHCSSTRIYDAADPDILFQNNKMRSIHMAGGYIKSKDNTSPTPSIYFLNSLSASKAITSMLRLCEGTKPMCTSEYGDALVAGQTKAEFLSDEKLPDGSCTVCGVILFEGDSN